MKTIRLTVAQALVKFLSSQYVEFDGKQQRFIKGFFTIFGHGNVLGLGQALEENAGELIVHQGRNEQGMVHAATGYAKQKLRKQIYACTSSVGPGAANMVTAARQRRRRTAFPYCFSRETPMPAGSPIPFCSRSSNLMTWERRRTTP